MPSVFDQEAHAKAMRTQGLWVDQTVDDLFSRCVQLHAEKQAIVAYRTDRKVPIRLSYRELEAKVDAAAAALRTMGIEPGDVVALQLPNWWEFIVTALACSRVGAVVNPLMPIFREYELTFMLGFSQAKLLVTPKSFRGFDHASMARSLRDQLPTLKHLAIVGETGEDGFEKRMLSVPGSGDTHRPKLSPNDLTVLMFTSGTTGQPKGVMHSSNTLIACTSALAERFHLGPDDVLLCCSPMGHMTGYAAIFLESLALGASTVLQDIWDPRRGVEIMAAEGVTHTAASTPFLADICDAVAVGAPHPRQLKTFLCGGAPIPPVLIDRALRELGLKVSSLWGMTETLGATLTEPERAHEKSASTDGRSVQGMEVKVVGPDGETVPTGETGTLMVRGAQMFLGYYKESNIPTFDAEGWFDSGDLAYIDADHYIRINGRTKDVLIRGGENIPVFEIESLFYKHPAVLQAALVGYPDDRLGERGAIFLVLRPDAGFTLADAQAWLTENKVAKQYWPERVEMIESMPATPSGKIQKFALRERAKAFSKRSVD